MQVTIIFRTLAIRVQTISFTRDSYRNEYKFSKLAFGNLTMLQDISSFYFHHVTPLLIIFINVYTNSAQYSILNLIHNSKYNMLLNVISLVLFNLLI